MSVTTLTKRLVATAQPKDRAYELRDAQVRGLLLRVQPSGHKAWVVTWEHGKRGFYPVSTDCWVKSLKA